MLAKNKYALCREGAKLPQKSEGSAGFDVWACFEEDYIVIEPHQSKLIPTGVMSVIDPNYYVLLEERGSTGTRNMKRSAGVIDANFRGEWFACIYNGNDKPLCIAKYPQDFDEELVVTYPYDKAICQALILPEVKEEREVISVEELKKYTSNRGEGQLGSSGN